MDRRVKPGDDDKRRGRTTPRAADMSETRRGGSFFGRRKGKALRPGQQHALDTVLPALRIDLAQAAPKSLATLFPAPVDAVRLEIGFGGGEHLLHAARENPKTGFIGVEPFESGLAKAATAILREALQNIRLYDDDATALLDWLPPASLTRVDLLFPDPWPKKRHWKRRFVNRENLQRIARALQPGGEFRFATDVEDYAAWTRETVAGESVLVTAGDATEPWPDWPGTRYEAKAAKAGRGAAYLTFRRADRL
jgi:tRNA (guanine-N7-)-methyltransferase